MAKRDEQVKKFDEKLNVESKYENERADTSLSKTTNIYENAAHAHPHTSHAYAYTRKFLTQRKCLPHSYMYKFSYQKFI